MSTRLFDITPFVPSDKALAQSHLPDKAMQLNTLSAKLMGQLTANTLSTLECYMRVINSYYSNLIEGHSTQPHDIRAAQRGDYSLDAVKRDLQQESLAHMAVQSWIRQQKPDLATIFSPDFILAIHAEFYRHAPDAMRKIKDDKGEVVDVVIGGEWRNSDVIIGRHIPPQANNIASLMQRFCASYNSNQFRGDRRLIAIMAAHHRFAWLHPFIDGNGRVGRLITDAALHAAGLESYGSWCISRGLARSASTYKALLAAADSPRQGDSDGRGALTEKGLMKFCDYMLDTAIDQAQYTVEQLDLSSLGQRINSYIQARMDGRVRGMTSTLKPSSALILHQAFLYGEIQRSQAIALTGLAERSARRLLKQLRDEGLLSETSSKSPLRWEIPEHAEPWYFPALAPQS